LGLAGGARQYFGMNAGRLLFTQIHRRFGTASPRHHPG
jgi:hypothetical protein